jgi:hypothetical protein
VQEKTFESILKLRNSTLHRQCPWRESKTSERDFLVKSEAVASKFSRGVTLVLGSQMREEVKTSWVYLTPKGRRKGQSPKSSKELGLNHGLLYAKVPAGFQARSLAQKSSRLTFQATSLRSEI